MPSSTNSAFFAVLAAMVLTFPLMLWYYTSSIGADHEASALEALSMGDPESQAELQSVEKHLLMQFEMAESLVEQQRSSGAWHSDPKGYRMDAQWLQQLRNDAARVASAGHRHHVMSAGDQLIKDLLVLGGDTTTVALPGGDGDNAKGAHGNGEAVDVIQASELPAKETFGIDLFETHREAYPTDTPPRGTRMTYTILTGGTRPNVLEMVKVLLTAGVEEQQIIVMVDCSNCYNLAAGGGYDLEKHFEVIATLRRLYPALQVVPVDLQRNHAASKLSATPSKVKSTSVHTPNGPRVARVEHYVDLDVPGKDILAARGTTEDTCVELCMNKEECSGAAFVREQNDCWMKDTRKAVDRKMVSAKGVDFYAICDTTEPNCPTPQNDEKDKVPAFLYTQDTQPIRPEERVGEVYYWLVDYLFGSDNGIEYAVVLEDDYTLSPDVHHFYTQSTFLLDQDPSLFCVSGHAEHAMEQHASDPGALLRTEFFPVLAWMTSRSAFNRWLKPVMPSDKRFGGSVSAGGVHSGHWDHFIKINVFRPPGEGGRQQDKLNALKFAQAVYAEVPRVVHRMSDGDMGAVSTSSGMQRVLYSPVKLQPSLYEGEFLSTNAVVHFEKFLRSVILEADAVLDGAQCVHETLWFRNFTFVVKLPHIKSEDAKGVAAWNDVLKPLQLWFTFNIFKGTFVTRWLGNRFVFVAAYSPLFTTVLRSGFGLRGSGGSEPPAKMLPVALDNALPHSTVFEQCTAAFKRTGLPVPKGLADNSGIRRPVLTLTGTHGWYC